MPTVTYDTSAIIAYKPAEFPSGFLMSAVVIQELTAGAADKSEVQQWDAARRAGALLVTENLRDFKMIRRFCAVRVISGADYFGRRSQ